MRNPNFKSCTNCQSDLSKDQKYCGSCGQKTKQKNWGVYPLLQEFVVNLVNVDSKVAQTLKDIWIPGRLTRNFFLGQRVKYYHPMRLLIVMVFGAFAIGLLTADMSSVDRVQREWKKDEETFRNQERASKLIDSLEIRDTILLKKIKESFGLNEGGDTTEIDLSFGFIDLEGMKRSDLMTKEPEEIIKDMDIQDWKEKLLVYQFHKLHKDPKGLTVFIISNSTWAIFSLILLMAIVLKLLYIRSNYYYVEHFVLLSHITSFSAFLAIIIALLILFIDISFGHFFNGIFLITILYGFLSLKNYYKQGWVKTFFKSVFFCISLLFMLSMVATAVAFIGFLVF